MTVSTITAMHLMMGGSFACGAAGVATIEGPAVVGTVRRLGRAAHAAISVTRVHAPRWLAIVLGIALAIPGPVDEAVVGLIIGWMVWRRPVMRAAMIAAVRDAWAGRPVVIAPAPVRVRRHRRVNLAPIMGRLAAATIAAALTIVPAVVVAPAANAATGAASFVIGHARHAHGRH